MSVCMTGSSVLSMRAASGIYCQICVISCLAFSHAYLAHRVDVSAFTRLSTNKHNSTGRAPMPLADVFKIRCRMSINRMARCTAAACCSFMSFSTFVGHFSRECKYLARISGAATDAANRTQQWHPPILYTQRLLVAHAVL